MPQTRPVTPEDLLELVLVSSPSLSSEGAVAYTVTGLNYEANRYDSSVWVADSSGYKPLTGGPGDVCPKWSPRGDLVAFVRKPQEKKGKAGIYVVRGSGGEAWKVAESRFGFREIEWSPDGRWIYFTQRAPLGSEKEWKDYSERDVLVIDSLPIWFNGEGFVFDRRVGLFRVDVKSGVVEEVARGAFNVVAYSVSPDGRVAYARTYDELKPYLHEVVVREADGTENVVLRGLSVAGLSWSPNGSSLAVHARDVNVRGFATHFQVYRLDPSGGEPECLTCSLERNVSNTANSDVRGPSCSMTVQWSDDGWIYFLVSDAGSVHLYRVKPGGDPQPVIAPSCGVVDEYSVLGGKIAYTMMTPTQPKELYLRDGSGDLRLTGHNDSWVKSRRLIEPRKYVVEASDGALIDVWVMDPSDSGTSPWVLYIHGGPKTMYGCGFIHEFQALAGAGFAVVYSNPRGSDGYTEEFADIRGRYGERDYKDLMEVADKITQLHRSLDPERAGVAGGSYGGFMTNWIITHTNRFKAAVTQRSCSNWISKYGTTDIGWYFNKDQIAKGKPVWEAMEVYWEKSPLKYVENIKTPLLIMHSLEDYRCYVDQATQMFVALKELGVKTRLALFPGESHDLSRTGRPRSRLARLKLIIEWFKENLL